MSSPAETDYDLIVIGSGPGGASLAHRLAPTGKRILILERGEYLPREEANWSSKAVFVDGRYQADETWRDQHGKPFHPQLHYFVGGNSKVYGAALFRLRERDFEQVSHHGGVSPAWPLSYADFAPWYDEAEALFHVHGLRGDDPLDPGGRAYPFVPVKHEPKVQELSDKLTGIGLKPFHLPLGILLDQKADGFATPTSVCMRCSFFDGFPCLLNGKADAQVMCIDPTLRDHPNVTLLTGAYVSRLETAADGKRVERVHVTRGGQEESFTAGTVVVACGALSSALLLLALGQRAASQRARQRLRSGRAQLHAPRDVDRHGGDEGGERDRLPEDARFVRLLLRRWRVGRGRDAVAAWPHPDVRHQPRRPDQGRGAARPLDDPSAGHAVRGAGPALDGFLAADRGPAGARQPRLLP